MHGQDSADFGEAIPQGKKSQEGGKPPRKEAGNPENQGQARENDQKSAKTRRPLPKISDTCSGVESAASSLPDDDDCQMMMSRVQRPLNTV
jgi:hypothetical protein